MTREGGGDDRERRKDWRLHVRGIGAVLLLPEGGEDEQRHPCDLLDVALAGVRIATAAPLRTGDEVVLAIPEVGEYAAEVRWVRPPEAGLAIAGGPDLMLKDLAEDPRISTLKPDV
ncbi:MAG: hypothetical protein KatS3mg119_1602 [Rhodothalassiaceae bacterium]|nr:MAG: hypothetical protein KatS3mg119_1602 [Rhodothalassiaceae bacterium]